MANQLFLTFFLGIPCGRSPVHYIEAVDYKKSIKPAVQTRLKAHLIKSHLNKIKEAVD